MKTVKVEALTLGEITRQVQSTTYEIYKGASISVVNRPEGGYAAIISLPGVSNPPDFDEPNGGVLENLRASALELALDPTATNTDFKADYKVENRRELIVKYDLFDRIVGKPEAVWMAYADINEVGYKEAAKRHGMDLKEFKDTYSLQWKKMAIAPEKDGRKLNHQKLGSRIGLTFEEMVSINPQLGYTRKHQAKQNVTPIK